MKWNKEIISENLQISMKVVTMLNFSYFPENISPSIPCSAQNPSKLFQDWRHEHVQEKSTEYALSFPCNLKDQIWHHI